MTDQWQKWKCKKSWSGVSTSSTSSNLENTVQYISAEIEFFADIQERIDDGEFIPMDQATQEYAAKMKQHNVNYIPSYL